MWMHISAILWAQMRVARNHLPQSNWGSVLLGLFALLWYGLYAVVAVFLAATLPYISRTDLRQAAPAGLLAVFVFWQFIPLLTLSTGWSLQLTKIKIFPISDRALFALETLLRITSAPEMILVILGAMLGALRRQDASPLTPLALLLFVLFNLFVSLAVREFVLHSFERNRFREVFAICIVSFGVLPQLLIRTGLRAKLSPYILGISHFKLVPWRAAAALSLDAFSPFDFVLCLLWLTLSYFLARRLFLRALRYEETMRGGNAKLGRANALPVRIFSTFIAVWARVFQDPLGALVQKELQSLVRMPRFRMVFIMACLFSVVVFVPLAFGPSTAASRFLANNFLAVVTLYGLLLLSDTLFLNAFGLDRSASQVYFLAPIPFGTVLRAKNIVGLIFVALQSATILLVMMVVRFRITWLNVLNSITAVAVIAVFLLSAGNFCSVSIPRPADPRQTMRKQAGGKLQLWSFVCSAGMAVLLSLAFLAEWAVDSSWGFFGVLIVEFAVGCVVYWIAWQSATERGLVNREKIVDALSKGSAVL